MDRSALRKLLSKVAARRIDVIVVYKVDRLTLAGGLRQAGRDGRQARRILRVGDPVVQHDD
jgi:DNA invertase Pin-like site-specific DNA recombinase